MVVKSNLLRARILLLNPPNRVVSTGVFLNLAYLAASLRKAGHEVKIIDATAPYNLMTTEQIKRTILEFNPHFIGVTLTIAFISQAYAYLKNLREMKVPIVAGGPHPNSLPEEVLEHGADIVVIGEGEETIVELAEYFLGFRELYDIAGLCFKGENGKFIYTPGRKLIENIDTIPFPDFADFPIKNYTGSSDVNSNPIFWSLFTSRGCPFNCTFCASHNVFGRTARMRSAGNVFEEIKNLVGLFGVERITFQDDEILCEKKRFLELCDLIADSRLKVKMSMRTRIDSIDKEILLKAKSAGLNRISFGIESWDDETLAKINKKYTVDKIHEKFKLIEETKFPFISFNIICGFPWETSAHLQNCLRQISKIPRSIAYYTNVVTPIPYPKTKLYDTYHKEFNFTNWWLDPKKHKYDINRIFPFFLNFSLVIYLPDATHNYFWNYSVKKQKEIEKFNWGIFIFFIRRHFNLAASILIIFLCRSSYLIWKLSPNLERLIFHFFPESLILRLKNKISFILKY